MGPLIHINSIHTSVMIVPSHRCMLHYSLYQYCRVEFGSIWQHKMVHALCMLGNESYRYALEICSTAFPQVQLTRACAPLLRFTYIACSVHVIVERCSCRSHAVQFASLTFRNKSVRCQSYDSLGINKHFPMNGVTQMLAGTSGTPVHSVNGVFVGWISLSEDLQASVLPTLH